MRHVVLVGWSRMSNLKNLNERLSFMQIGPQVQSRLRGIKPIVMAALPEALEVFFARLREIPEAMKTLREAGGEERLRQAKARQLAQWELATNGRLENG